MPHATATQPSPILVRTIDQLSSGHFVNELHKPFSGCGTASGFRAGTVDFLPQHACDDVEHLTALCQLALLVWRRSQGCEILRDRMIRRKMTRARLGLRGQGVEIGLLGEREEAREKVGHKQEMV